MGSFKCQVVKFQAMELQAFDYENEDEEDRVEENCQGWHGELIRVRGGVFAYFAG